MSVSRLRCRRQATNPNRGLWTRDWWNPPVSHLPSSHGKKSLRPNSFWQLKSRCSDELTSTFQLLHHICQSVETPIVRAYMLFWAIFCWKPFHALTNRCRVPFWVRLSFFSILDRFSFLDFSYFETAALRSGRGSVNRFICSQGDDYPNRGGAQTICSKIRTPVRILSLQLLNEFFQACFNIKSLSYLHRPSSSNENDNGQKASPRKSHLETTSKAGTNPTNISKWSAYCQSNCIRQNIFHPRGKFS